MHSPRPVVLTDSTGEHSSISYVILLSTIAAISGFLFGFDTAVINGVLLFFRKQFALTNLETEIAASSLLLGCLIGAASASLLGDRYGRKKSLMGGFVISSKYSVSSYFVLRHAKYVYDCEKPAFASQYMIFGLVNASARKITSG